MRPVRSKFWWQNRHGFRIQGPPSPPGKAPGTTLRKPTPGTTPSDTQCFVAGTDPKPRATPWVPARQSPPLGLRAACCRSSGASLLARCQSPVLPQREALPRLSAIKNQQSSIDNFFPLSRLATLKAARTGARGIVAPQAADAAQRP